MVPTDALTRFDACSLPTTARELGIKRTVTDSQLPCDIISVPPHLQLPALGSISKISCVRCSVSWRPGGSQFFPLCTAWNRKAVLD